ncbi:MAG: translocation/assembly module TamB [Treponema sp.]|nr:translocation/assembly module TamB [Treponema sp.]
MENSAKDNTGTVKQKASKKRKISRNIHIIIEVLVFTALIGITALLLQPLRVSILRQMTEMRDYLIKETEVFLGRKIEYASMGPSIFATLDIRDIRILNDNDEAVLTIRRFRLSYSLLSLITGELQNSLRSIRIDMPVINMDTERDADLIALFAPASSDSQIDNAALERSWQGLNFLPDEIQVRIRSGSGMITFGENDVSVEGLSFDGNIEYRRVVFTSRWKAETALSGLFNQDIQALMSGEISGDFSADLTNGNLNLYVPSIEGDLFTFKSLTMNLAVSPEVIEFRKIMDRSPYDLFVTYEIDTDTLNAEFFADNFSLRDVLSFNGNWASYNEWLYIQTSGHASFFSSGDNNFQYEVDLSGKTPIQLAAENVSFELKSRGDSARADFFPLRFDSPYGSLFFQGDLGFQQVAVNGNLEIADFSLTGVNPLNAAFSINTYDNEISIFSESVSVGSLTLSAFDSYVINQPNELSFSVSALRFQDIESYDNVSISRVNLDAAYEFNPQHLQASFLLDSFSAEDMLQAISPFVTIATPEIIQSEANKMLVTTEVFVTTDFEHVSYNAPQIVAAYNGSNDVLTLFSVSGTDGRFELSNGSILIDNTLDFSGNADISNIDDISFSVQAIYDDFSYFFDGLFLDQRLLTINGSYGFNAYLSITDQGDYSGSISADSIPIPFENGMARFSLSTFIRWTDPEFWSVEVERIEFADLPMPDNALGHLMIQGMADNNGATFPNILFDDGKGALSGTATANWMSDFSMAAGIILLTDQSGAEQYSAEVNYENSLFDASISGSQMQLSRFLENASNIVASADANIHGTSAQSFSLGMNLSSLTGMIAENQISAHAHINADQDTALIQDANVLFGDIDIDLPSLEINRLESHLSAALNINGRVIEKDFDTGIIANAYFTPIDSWFNILEVLASFQGSLNVHKFLVDTEPKFAPFHFDVSKDETMLTVKGGPEEMLRFSMSNEGDFYAGFSNPAPFRGSIIGNISDGQLDAHTSKLYVDMLSLFTLVPDEIKKTIDVPGGFVDVSVQVKGSLLEPEFFGTALGTSIRISLPAYLTADIGPTPLLIQLEGTEMTFGPITTKVGTGQAQVSGMFLFNGWIPDTFNLDIFVDEETPVPYRISADRLRVRGNASGNVAIAYENMEFDIRGDLTAYDTILSMGDAPVPVPIAQDPRTITYATVDMNITSGPRVEFLFPNEIFPIVSAYANIGSRINVFADTRSGSYSVTGDVGLRGGDIYYINRSFYIREGQVVFNENELGFNPLITARADITEVAQDGPVTISLILDNAPVLSFEPRYESTPPLSQLEIMSLLGQQNLSDGSSDPMTIISIGADFFSQFAVTQNIQRRMRDLFGFDMFSVRTQLLQNTFFLMTGIQDPASFGNLGNFFNNSSVYIGKYVTQDMFLQAMGSMLYDERSDFFGIGFGLDIGLELSSPLVDMRLNFVPSHPENMFIDDLSLTLSWKMTF